VHRPLTADGSITVEVTSLTEVTESGLTSQGRPVRTEPAVVPWSKAGLIITAGAAQGSAYAAVMVTGSHGARMQWNYTGDTPGPAGRVSAASLEQIGPMTAGLAIQATTSLNTLPISPWAGLGVLAAWAAGALLLRMRDA
jgi:hypothetical protein